MASTEVAVAPHKKSLVMKLAEVMGDVGHVPKSGRNEFHRYDYATEADIVAAVRSGMARLGVMLIPSIEKIEWTERAMNGKAPMKIATITVRFTFLDGESDSKIEFVGMGQGEDASDKAIYKAMTGAEKYALLKTFLIPTGDDPEADPVPQGGKKAYEAKPQAKPQSPQQSAPPPATIQKPSAHAPAKRPAAIIDVKPGESEEQAKARQSAVQAPRPKSDEPSNYERIRVMAGEYGLENLVKNPKALGQTVISITGKTSTLDITTEDIAVMKQHFEKAVAAAKMVDQKLNTTPGREPGSDDGLPF